MVPLRLDVCEERPRLTQTRPQPLLVLRDIEQELSPRRNFRRSPWSRFENVLLATAAAAVLLFFLGSFAASLFQSVQQRYYVSAMPSRVTMPYTVHRGDTLTRIASRFGDPSTYILDYEDQIARANHLSGNAPLVPGQHLVIPVTNKTVIARLGNTSPRTVIASR